MRDVPRLLRAAALEQVDDARRELMERTRDARMGLVLLGVAAGLALVTLTTLAVALTIALAEVLPWWGATLAIVAPLAVAAGILAAVGMRRISTPSADDLVEEETRTMRDAAA